MRKKISDLPKKEFNNEIIDNCFYVEKPDAPLYFIPIKQIIEYIIDRAKKEGLTIEYKNDYIILK